ncbi:hypothetical protein EW146_g8996 [Bondarzewia mesenterica]|uniref:Uncharacterized protein n=1 Tax=Bondarzewia mesenterica TaxID=1095465 RepID=A0A4S4L9Z1_9AGAM|nr:hypothetical protein EW146_g8996 [Bondarzewia mesenterica]
MIGIISTLLIIRVQLNAEREARYTTGFMVSSFRAVARKTDRRQYESASTDRTLEGSLSPSRAAGFDVIANGDY